MHFLLALAVAVSSVEGVVTAEHSPLPGATVTLTSRAGEKRVRIANVDGEYRFEALRPGEYTLKFELDGLEAVERSITVQGGTNAQPAAELEVSPRAESITLACGSSPCTTTDPETVWDIPSCADYELDTALIEALERNDASAPALLRRRYENATTYAQKHRIAAAIFGRVADDRVYWNELIEHARNAVRFAHSGEETAKHSCSGARSEVTIPTVTGPWPTRRSGWQRTTGGPARFSMRH